MQDSDMSQMEQDFEISSQLSYYQYIMSNLHF